MPNPNILTILVAVPQEQGFNGPFPFNTSVENARFVFGFRATDGLITAVKTVDAGVSWAEMDGGNAKVRGTAVVFLNCVKHASYPATPIVYVIYLNALEQFAVSAFNVSTGVWGTTVTSTLGYTAGPPSPNTNDNSWHVTHRGSDNTIVLFVSTVLVDIGGGFLRWRAQYATCDLTGAAWSAYTQVGTAILDNFHYYAQGSVEGAGGLTHFMFQKTNISGSDQTLVHVSLTLAGVLSSNQVVYTGNVALNNTFRRGSNMIARLDANGAGTQIIFPLRVEDTANLYQYVFTAFSAVTPVWTGTVIATITPVVAFGTGYRASPLCVFENDGTLYGMWVRTNLLAGNTVTSEIRRATSANGTTWTADEQFYLEPLAGYAFSGAHIGGAQVGA